MPVPELTQTPKSSTMAKRQKTDDKKTTLPDEPSDVAKVTALSIARRPDINEYQVNIDADLDSKPPLPTSLSEAELPPGPAHHKQQKKKDKEKEKEL